MLHPPNPTLRLLLLTWKHLTPTPPPPTPSTPPSLSHSPSVHQVPHRWFPLISTATFVSFSRCEQAGSHLRLRNDPGLSGSRTGQYPLISKGLCCQEGWRGLLKRAFFSPQPNYICPVLAFLMPINIGLLSCNCVMSYVPTGYRSILLAGNVVFPEWHGFIDGHH